MLLEVKFSASSFFLFKSENFEISFKIDYPHGKQQNRQPQPNMSFHAKPQYYNLQQKAKRMVDLPRLLFILINLRRFHRDVCAFPVRHIFFYQLLNFKECKSPHQQKEAPLWILENLLVSVLKEILITNITNRVMFLRSEIATYGLISEKIFFQKFNQRIMSDMKMVQSH